MNICIILTNIVSVAPARERGLKSSKYYTAVVNKMVAPARERGLKYKGF